MKKITLLLILGVFLLTACGPRDKQSQLQRMERQRDALNEKIEQLEAEIAQSSGGQPQMSEKLMYVAVKQVNPLVFQHFIKVQGTVESDNNILIPSQTSGIVKKILVDEGDRVTKGQLLAELDGAIYESSIAEMENALDLANTIFERRKRLWDKNIGSEIDFLQAKNNKENLEKRLETLNEQYQLTKITSPINGTVDDIMIKEGEMAAAGRGAIRIVQLSRLKIVAALSENHISRIKKNAIVSVEIPVLDLNFENSIDSVSQVIDPDNRTFDIEIEVHREQKNIKPNMLAVVTITDYTNPQAIVVPQNIIQKTGTENFLFSATKENGRWIASRKVVQTGENYNDRVEILTGINPGDFVVISGFQNLADGQRVSVTNQD
ncbi:MAG: efflux RND transporter periplasmic adaptor subunit [Candidatus Aminicenantes bacterium]|nr:efflux RND transporter periplasmic adaptor subunit [Candidatus Aminicenantes bacterium]